MPFKPLLSTPKQAILIFARDAKEELAHRNFIGLNAKKKGKLLALFTQKIKLEAAKTQQAVFVLRSNKQQGETFAERLQCAFKQLIAKGFTQVVAVGIDTPGIKANDIQQAFKALVNNDFVAGPDKRGGCYLIGAHSTALAKYSLSTLAFQSNALLNSFQEFSIQAAFSLHVLPKSYSDVHYDAALFESLKEIPNSQAFAKQIRAILLGIRTITSTLIHYISAYYLLFNSRRGPPAYVFT